MPPTLFHIIKVQTNDRIGQLGHSHPLLRTARTAVFSLPRDGGCMGASSSHEGDGELVAFPVVPVDPWEGER